MTNIVSELDKQDGWIKVGQHISFRQVTQTDHIEVTSGFAPTQGAFRIVIPAHDFGALESAFKLLSEKYTASQEVIKAEAAERTKQAKQNERKSAVSNKTK